MTKNHATKQEINNMISNLELCIKTMPEFDAYGKPIHHAYRCAIEVLKRDNIDNDNEVQFYLDEEVLNDLCSEDDETYITNLCYDALDWKLGKISIEEFITFDEMM